MKKSRNWFKTNLFYGLLVLIPIAVIIVLVEKAMALMEKLAVALGLETTLDAGLAIVVAVLLILSVCIACGVIVRTSVGAWTFQRFERAILQRVPGYDLIANILKGFAANTDAYPAALVRLFGPGSAVFGIVMEDHSNGVLTVFVPSAPAFTVGGLHIVERDRVTFLDVGTVSVADAITQWGIGSQKLLGEARP